MYTHNSLFAPNRGKHCKHFMWRRFLLSYERKSYKEYKSTGGWGGRGSLTLLADEFKKSKLVLGLKELRFKNSHQVSYKGGLWKEIIWYNLILWFFHSKNWSIFNEIRARIFEKLQYKKFIMASSKGNRQWCWVWVHRA